MLGYLLPYSGEIMPKDRWGASPLNNDRLLRLSLAYLLPALCSKVEGRAICGADDDIRYSATAALQYLIVSSFIHSSSWKLVDKMDEKQQLVGSLPVVNDISEQRAQAKKSSRWGTVKLVCLEIAASR